MVNYISIISAELGVSLWLLFLIFIWSSVWKLLALWKSARKGSVIWFIVLAVFNTLGILPILYIFIFSKMKCKPVTKNPKLKTKREKGKISNFH